MKDFWKWLTSKPDDEERRRLEREGADIDVVYGLRPSYIFFALTLLQLLNITLTVILRRDDIWGRIDIYVFIGFGLLVAAIFSHFMEKRWSWRRTGVIGLLVAIAAGAAFYFAQGLIF
ncbi:MAG: hypothetical protein IKS49_06300 [Actinomycetaceae bacterium]|nr:hypothetical protein [Actinomycetaceae bacterium]